MLTLSCQFAHAAVPSPDVFGRRCDGTGCADADPAAPDAADAAADAATDAEPVAAADEPPVSGPELTVSVAVAVAVAVPTGVSLCPSATLAELLAHPASVNAATAATTAPAMEPFNVISLAFMIELPSLPLVDRVFVHPNQETTTRGIRCNRSVTECVRSRRFRSVGGGQSSISATLPGDQQPGEPASNVGGSMPHDLNPANWFANGGVVGAAAVSDPRGGMVVVGE